MPDIDNEISKLIKKLRKNYKIPGYTHNSRDNFIPGVTPVYYSGAYYDDKEVIASVKSMLIGKWMTAGESVSEFERKFSDKLGLRYKSCMTNSGSSANLIMIASLKKALGWQDGDEIIVSVVGFPTTISVIAQNNLTPVFIDIEPYTLNFDISLIQDKITPRTRAIFLSPVLGNPCDIDTLIYICAENNLKIILDNCDSLGSRWDGNYLTDYAIASSCSFYAAHEICTFEGGMISSTVPYVLKTARSMINWGRDCVCSGTENLLPDGVCKNRFSHWLSDYDGIIDHKYVFSNMGYNLKPLDVSGAIGLVQLEKLNEIMANRNISKQIICSLFERYIDGIRIPSQLEKADTVWFGSPVICVSKQQKNALVSHLEKNKIQTRNYFAGNILIHPGYKHLGNWKDYPHANRVLDTVFFVGASPSYGKKVFDYIEQVLKEF